MSRVRVVLDTNVLLVSLSSRSSYHWLFQELVASRYDAIISNEILTEYEEIVREKFSNEAAENLVRTLLLLPNVHHQEVYYRWNLITVDPDDNKFVDCAIASGASAIVTHDRHFDLIKQLSFPRLAVLSD